MREVAFDGTLAGWRIAARAALMGKWDPTETWWVNTTVAQVDLALNESAPAPGAPRSRSIHVPRTFLALAEEVSCHRDEVRWSLLYRVLWRLTHEEPHLLEVATDPDIQALRGLAKSVHKDMHKMRAFVRFREVATAEGTWFVAWFEPEHHVVEANAPFFRDRFTNLRWSILTPDRCVHWDLSELTFTPGVPPSSAPAADAMEELWRTYYRNIFNPARLSLATLTTHMPRRYWKNLPEAGLISELAGDARSRSEKMISTSVDGSSGQTPFSRPLVPDTRELPALRVAASACRACPLWRNATCTVFGEGPGDASVVVVGEQPGDQEDRQGRPFVGPAGLLLDRALAAAGVPRSALYLTNAVKHFKWEPRGKRRLHQRPSAREVAACRPWLEAELAALRPKLIVCLGATAAHSITGRDVRVLSERSQKVDTEFGAPALITVHPSALLRTPAGADPAAEFARFVADLKGINAAR